MSPNVRRVLAVIAGLAVAFLVIVVIEMICTMVYPPPPGTDPHDPASLKSAMAAMPAGALAGVVLAWVLGTLVGSFTTAKIGATGGLFPGATVGIVILAAAVMNMVALPHPVWVWVAALVLIPAAAALGARLGTRSA